MKKALLMGLGLLLLVATTAAAEQVTLNGAGATFPYPVYSQWAYKYNQLKGMQLNYQSIGSGGGIAQIKAKTVDFGASDAPMEPEELSKAGLFQFPMIIGGVVPVLNVSGIQPGQLQSPISGLFDVGKHAGSLFQAHRHFGTRRMEGGHAYAAALIHDDA